MRGWNSPNHEIRWKYKRKAGRKMNLFVRKTALADTLGRCALYALVTLLRILPLLHKGLGEMVETVEAGGNPKINPLTER